MTTRSQLVSALSDINLKKTRKKKTTILCFAVSWRVRAALMMVAFQQGKRLEGNWRLKRDEPVAAVVARFGEISFL